MTKELISIEYPFNQMIITDLFKTFNEFKKEINFMILILKEPEEESKYINSILGKDME